MIIIIIILRQETEHKKAGYFITQVYPGSKWHINEVYKAEVPEVLFMDTVKVMHEEQG